MRTVEIADRKDFTEKLFLQDTFDGFLLREASFTTFASFSVDGRFRREFYDSREQELLPDQDYITWKQARPYCLSVIRGRRLPLRFRMILELPAGHPFCQAHPELAPAAESQELFLNIQYKEQVITCTSGSSMTRFIPGVFADQTWDDLLAVFLQENHILF